MIYRNEVKHEINAGDKAAIIANLRGGVPRSACGQGRPLSDPQPVL